MPRYYTLVIKNEDGRWCPEFGDYDRETVVDERDDRIDSEECTFLTSTIIATGDTQAEIDLRITRMNDVGPVL